MDLYGITATHEVLASMRCSVDTRPGRKSAGLKLMASILSCSVLADEIKPSALKMLRWRETTDEDDE